MKEIHTYLKRIRAEQILDENCVMLMAFLGEKHRTKNSRRNDKSELFFHFWKKGKNSLKLVNILLFGIYCMVLHIILYYIILINIIFK